MPPEQVNRMRGEATVLPTTDIFSFGVLAFQLLTGSLPFGELTSHNELALYQKRGKDGDWNRRKLVQIKNGKEWDRLFSGCLNPDFKNRFQSVKEVLKYLPETQQSLWKGILPTTNCPRFLHAYHAWRRIWKALSTKRICHTWLQNTYYRQRA